MKNSFLKGAYILTAASFLVKIFGFIYVIPFVAMVGEQKYILFEYAYKPYVILLSIATLGIPSAVAKFVSKYREKGDFYAINALLKSGTIFVTIMGVISFIVLYLGAETVAHWLVDPTDKTGNSIEEVTFVIKMVSYALIVVPLLALARGITQGYQDMLPTSVSQVLEQIVRITIILLGTYIVVKVLDGSPVMAVGIATFSAFVSAVVALLIVIWYIVKRKYIRKAEKKSSISHMKLYKEIISYAIPFVFVGLAIPLFQSIDTFMINSTLMQKGYNLGEAETINALVSLNQKIIVIPLALATAFSVSLVAYITKANEAKKISDIREHINQAVKSIMFFVLPSVAGMFLLAKPIFGVIFGTDLVAEGGSLLAWYAASALFYSLFSITAAILQGLDQQKWVVLSLLGGIVIKVLTNYPLILIFNGEGTAISTYLGFGFSILFQAYLIQKVGKYKWIENLSALKNIAKQTVMMSLALIPFAVCALYLNSYLSLLILLIAALIAAGSIYFILAYKNESLFLVIGKGRIDHLLIKLKLKK